MKKLFITILLAIAAVTGAFAVPKVDAAILANFNTTFEQADNVQWHVTDEYTKAAFTQAGTKMEVYYNYNGDIIGRSKSISLDELPVNAKRRFAKKFAGYEAREALRFESDTESAYYISGKNDRESVIFKVNDDNQVLLFKKTKK